jgi:hypothetical protein
MTTRKGPKCGGKKHQGEGTCTQPAGWGTTHPGHGRCKLHGGNSPAGRTAGAEQQARAELAKLGVAPVADPLTELAAITGEVVAWKNAMAGKVNELTSLRYDGEFSGEQLRSEVLLWERALDRCEKFLTAMARCNIDERLARVTERQTEIVAAALSAALAEMGLPADQQREAQGRVARHLRAV